MTPNRRGHMASYIERRKFLATLGGAAASPLAARAQQPAIPVIGFIGGSSAENSVKRLEAFRKGLRETGYVEGRHMARSSDPGRAETDLARIGLGVGHELGNRG